MATRRRPTLPHVRFGGGIRAVSLSGTNPTQLSEDQGPIEDECPAAILDLLTPTNQPHAVEWRARCRARLAQRRALSAKPAPKAGQTIVFAAPIAFANGRRLDRFEVVSNPRSQRTVLFRDPVRGGLYRIPNVKARDYRLVDPKDG